MTDDFKRAEYIFNQLCRNDSKLTVFSSILDLGLLPFRYCRTNDQLKTAQDRLLSWPDKEAKGKFLTAMAHQSEGFRDPLGKFFLRYVARDYPDLKLTPATNSYLTTVTTANQRGKKEQLIFDLACRSGARLLSEAKINMRLKFYGADADATYCKIALMNMLTNALSGEIAYMDRVSKEFHWGYQFKTLRKGRHQMPYFTDITGPDESIVWLRSKVLPKALPANSDQLTPNHADRAPHSPDQQSLQQGSLF